MLFSKKSFCTAIFASALVFSAHAQESTSRRELTRSPLTGTNMEVIVSISETKPGESIPRHIHHGEEVFYVLEGATAELPDGKKLFFEPGVTAINARDVPHSGFKVIGDKTLKLLVVHVVDRYRPLYDSPN
jgi:quercetin dioxygenase-like cupin family protein